MGNKIRIKQIDLQGIFSASSQVDILSASNYASFVTQLDTTMSSDSELAAVSSSISQSIYTINQVIGSGLVSGSSQISILGFATTGSNTFTGDITLVSSSNIILRGPGDDGYSGAGDLIFQDGGGNETARLWKSADNHRLTVSFTGSHNSYIFGTLIHSLNLKEFGDDHFILTSSFNQFTESIDSRVDSLEAVTSSYLTSLDGAISGAGQISDLGFVTGSYTTINSFNSLTQSFNSISQSFNVISGSVGTVDFSTFATTGSNSFNGNQTITGSLIQGLEGNIATGENSHAEGSITKAIGNYSHAEGDNTQAKGDYSHAEGQETIASGSYSHTEGYQTIALANHQHVQGQYNAVSSVPSAFIVGNGTDDINRSNLIHAAGNDVEITGSLKVSGSIFLNQGDILATNGVISGSSQLTSSFDTRYATSASYLTSLNGAISSSSQLTSSYDTRYTLSGSVQPLPNGLISGSSQLTASYDTRYTLSGSVVSGTTPTGTISGSSQLTSSFDTRYAASGSNLTYFLEAYADVTYTLPGTFTEDTCRYSVVSTTENVPSNWFNTSTYTFTPQKAGYWEIVASYDVYRNTEASMAIKKNGSIVAAAGSFNAVAQEVSKTVYLNGSTDYINIINVGGAALQRDQYQTRSWFQAKFVGVVDSSAQLPLGLVSGSSQLTSSYDSRYVLSGSVSTGTISGSSQLTSSFDTRYTLSGSVVSGTTPTGTISGSSQLTSSFDGRYVQTGSFNSLTASFNSFTASAQSVTTGSNSFNGTQTITGSLIITTGSFVASQILANTASLYLTSGSNMYVQNNGLVEITGSLIVSGSTMFVSAGGDEGGEIQFGIPTTNTTLQNRVTVDVWRNRLRIFEGSAGANGVFIDLSKPTGNNNEITYKASGLVNAGDFVQLDNIKATVTTSGQRGLSLATISGTIAVNMAGNYAGSGVGVGGSSGTASITTSASTSLFGWGFTATGDMANYIITDTTNSRAYRIIIQIGASFNNNLVSIERLH